MHRITYRTLAKLIEKMSETQKDMDVTVEIPDDDEGEFFSASLCICQDNGILDNFHPVIRADVNDELQDRSDNIEEICEDIEDDIFSQESTNKNPKSS